MRQFLSACIISVILAGCAGTSTYDYKVNTRELGKQDLEVIEPKRIDAIHDAVRSKKRINYR